MLLFLLEVLRAHTHIHVLVFLAVVVVLLVLSALFFRQGDVRLQLRLVIQYFYNALVYFEVNVLGAVPSCVRSDKRPYNGDYAGADRAFSEELEFQLFYAEHLVDLLGLVQAREVEVFVLWLSDLKADSHLI